MEEAQQIHQQVPWNVGFMPHFLDQQVVNTAMQHSKQQDRQSSKGRETSQLSENFHIKLACHMFLKKLNFLENEFLSL